MIVNTTILSQHIKDKTTVKRIMDRAVNQMGVKTFSKMGKNARGAICSYTNFDLNEWIYFQEKFTKTARKDFREQAKLLLGVAKRVRGEMR